MINEFKHTLDHIQEMETLIYETLNNDNYLENYTSEEKLNFLSECYKTKLLLEEKIENTFSSLTEEQSLEMLQEINIRRLDKKTQVQLRKIMIAISMAKAANDPLYFRYKKGVMLRKAMKEMILRKYGPKAYQQALSELHK